MYSLLPYIKNEASPFNKLGTDITYYSKAGIKDANAVWDSCDKFSLVELEESFVNEIDDENIQNCKSAYLKSFQETIENKVIRYSDQLLDYATSYVYCDTLSEHGIVIVQFNVNRLLNELETLMQTNKELQEFFNPRYGGCSIYTFNLAIGNITFSLFDALKDTGCIQKYIITDSLAVEN